MRPPGRPRPRGGRRAAAVLGWWCALFPLWFLFNGEDGGLTALWGAGAAAVAAVAAVLVTGREPAAGRHPGVRWTSDLLSAARQTVVDFAVITAVLARCVAAGDRGPVGRFVHRDVPQAAEATDRLLTWLTVVATYSPNAYVLDIDPASGRALLHDLRPWRPSEEPV